MMLQGHFALNRQGDRFKKKQKEDAKKSDNPYDRRPWSGGCGNPLINIMETLVTDGINLKPRVLSTKFIFLLIFIHILMLFTNFNHCYSSFYSSFSYDFKKYFFIVSKFCVF